MTEEKTDRIRVRNGRITRVLGALVLALGLSAVLPTGSAAAELLPPATRTNLPAVLASITVLSDVAMANETGAGLANAAVLENATGHARVQLWDELRAPPPIAPANNATLTIGTGAPGK